MLRMTKQADYGIVLMTHMAGDPARRLNATEIAAEARLPQPIVSKILKLLTRDGLLVSQRGVKGGYSLARTAQEISVAEIIEALEGPIAVTECIDDTPGECLQESVCPLRGNWQRINQAIRLALEEITLSEMIQPAAPGLVTLGGRGSENTVEAR